MNMQMNPYYVAEVMTALRTNEGNIPRSVFMTEAPHLWEEAEQGEGITVAVLDTGCDIRHPDLQGAIIGGKNYTTDFGGNPNNYHDNNGHGTHVAGTIGARGQILGMAPKCNLLICKVLTGEGTGQYDWIIRAIKEVIQWRGNNGERVRVINLSLGGAYDIPELKEAVLEAVLNDISVVVASGNEGTGSEEELRYSYPASYNEVIQVGAVDYSRNFADFTNMNEEVDVVACGVDVISTYPNNQYAKLSGTSMATPHVSGAIALLTKVTEKRFKRGITESEMYAQLVKHTIPIGYQPSTEGNGLIKLETMHKVLELIEYIQTNYD